MNCKNLLPVGIALATMSCASNPDTIDAAYVSPMKYSSYGCDQISMELDYVGQRTNTLYQDLRAKRRGDNWQMGVGLVLFWPALFALEGGDGSDATEYAQLKGEFEALRQTSVQKRCNLAMRSPDEIMTAASEAEAPGVQNVQSEQENSAATDPTPLTQRLLELDELHKQGLISEAEYQQARQQALGL